MSPGDVRTERSLLADLVAELERGCAGRPEEIARRLGPRWSGHDVRAALAALFSDGVVGHNHEVGFWWVA